MKFGIPNLQPFAAAILLTIVGSHGIASGVLNGGGGGDSNEMRVNEIRTDILSWINNGGANGFRNWPEDLSPESYRDKMTLVLRPHAVVVGFVTSHQEQTTENPELRVQVDRQPKSCRGFFAKADGRPHIICNADRFPVTPADQYRLIHHEFAGLAGVEKNDGADSDYLLSDQITDFLVPETVYRLAVRDRDKDSIAVPHLREQWIKFQDVRFGDGVTADSDMKAKAIEFIIENLARRKVTRTLNGLSQLNVYAQQQEKKDQPGSIRCVRQLKIESDGQFEAGIICGETYGEEPASWTYLIEGRVQGMAENLRMINDNYKSWKLYVLPAMTAIEPF